MTDDIKEVQELAKYYQNYAEYYHEKSYTVAQAVR